jgi:hypothetical protein
MKPVLQLFDQIMALKGFRQVTVATPYLGARTYDVSEDGVIGYAATHQESRVEHLEEAVDNGGGIVVHEFQAEKVLVMMPVGSRMLPVKHIFGVRAGQGRWTGLSSEDVRAAHMTDCKTGKALEPEKGSDSSTGPGESRRASPLPLTTQLRIDRSALITSSHAQLAPTVIPVNWSRR